jgi:hypothetical protein
MLNLIMLSVNMLNFIMLSVMAPNANPGFIASFRVVECNNKNQPL